MDIIERILSGDIRALSRMISRIESDDPEIYPILKSIYAKTGHAHIIGLTGPPGAGKSTLIGSLVPVLLARGKKVAVLAVDPSSEFTGGAVLGDRIRMPLMHQNLYIRSFGSRGHLGGLSRACGNALRLLDAAGFDLILVETVGVGQSETEIKKYAHTVVVISAPNLGDDVQSMKAGILEVGDIFVVNKAELPGADFTESDLVRMTHLNAGNISHITPAGCHGAVTTSIPVVEGELIRIPPVIKVSSVAGFGVEELANAIEDHWFYLQQEDLSQINLQIVEQELSEQLRAEWETTVLNALKESQLWDEICRDVVLKHSDPWSAKKTLWEAMQTGNSTSSRTEFAKS